MNRRLGLTAAVIGVFAFQPATSTEAPAPKPAICSVNKQHEGRYEGPCDFTLGRKGSFSVTGKRGTPIMGYVARVTVTITEPSVAEISAVTRDGKPWDWGYAERVEADPACWQGDDFWVCAR